MPFSCMSCVQSNRKVGYIKHEVLNSTYQVLTKLHKVCTKSLFCFRKKGSEKHSLLVLIFNKQTEYMSKVTGVLATK